MPRITLWSLRHSFGTAACLDAKIPIKTVSVIMGHKDESTTRALYVLPQEEDMTRAMAAISSLY